MFVRETFCCCSSAVQSSSPHPYNSSAYHRLSTNSYVDSVFLIRFNAYLLPVEPRRAAVSILIRVVPSPHAQPATLSAQPTLSEFFELDWVKDPNARAEILFLKRDTPLPEETAHSQPQAHNHNEAHVAFPGGRTEPDDEGGMYTGALCFVHNTC